jgi:branched-chain amino acid transport system substrate-binding protein
MENWKEARPPRVGVMGGDTAYGRALDVMGSAYAESVGIEMLPMEFVPYVPLDTTPQLLRMKKANPDYIHISSFAITALAVLRDAQRLGLMGEIQFAGYETSQCELLLEVLGPDAEGYLAARTGPWGGEDVEGLKLCHDLQMKYHGNIISQGDQAVNIRLISVICEALRRAIEEVGYENLDGAAAKVALDSIKDFDPLGVGSTTYTPEDHEGSHRIRIYQVQGGEVVPVSDWREAPMLVPGK